VQEHPTTLKNNSYEGYEAVMNQGRIDNYGARPVRLEFWSPGRAALRAVSLPAEGLM
jgi:hypothetical protein